MQSVAPHDRIYTFPNNAVKVVGVCSVEEKSSGEHEVSTLSGQHFVINAGWLHIQKIYPPKIEREPAS